MKSSDIRPLHGGEHCKCTPTHVHLVPSTTQEAHLTTIKRIFCYFKGTINLCMKYERSANNHLVGFSDVNWAGDMNDRHSTEGNLFMMSGAAIN